MKLSAKRRSPNNLRNFLAWKFVGIVFLLSRLWVALFVYLGHTEHPYLSPVPGGWIGVNNWWLNPWTTYDSYYYLQIASQGYTTKSSAFFPLYPLLLKLAGPGEIAMAAWGIFLNHLALLVALYFFYRLTRHDFNATVARISVIALAFFPTTMFFSAVYTESLFLLLVVGMFYAWRMRRWNVAILCVFLASLTRNAGPLLAVMMAIECWQAKRRNVPLPRYAWLTPLAPLLGLLLFQGYLHMQFQGGVSSLQAQELFGRTLTWPWTPLYRDLLNLFPNGKIYLDALLNTFVAIVAFVLVWRNWKKFPASSVVYVLGINLMNLCFSRITWPYSISSARYQMSTFPFTQMMAKEVVPLWHRRLARTLILAVYLVICAMMCWLFSQKSFIG